MLDTYRMLCRRNGIKPALSMERTLLRIGERPFSHKPTLRPGARTVMRLLSGSYRLVLFTAGNPDIQNIKIDRLHLRAIFEKIFIVPMKTPHQLRSLLHAIHARPENVLLVGNSVRSDIVPATAIGVRAILLNSSSWAFDNSVSRPGGITSIGSLIQLPALVSRHWATSRSK